MTDYQEWLSTLKPGDSWTCVGEFAVTGPRIFQATVLRMTATQIVCGIGNIEQRFRRNTGRAVGLMQWHELPMPATDDQIRAIRDARKKAIRLNGIIAVLRAEGQTLPLETIEQIAELIEKARTVKVKS